MGTIGYVRQVLDDTNWYAQAEPIYEAAPTKNERIAYDRTEVTLSEAKQRASIASQRIACLRHRPKQAREDQAHLRTILQRVSVVVAGFRKPRLN